SKDQRLNLRPRSSRNEYRVRVLYCPCHRANDCPRAIVIWRRGQSRLRYTSRVHRYFAFVHEEPVGHADGFHLGLHDDSLLLPCRYFPGNGPFPRKSRQNLELPASGGQWYPELVSERRSTLFGRTREVQLLLSGLDAAREGRGGLALIAGEPGIGKTRLLEEV